MTLWGFVRPGSGCNWPQGDAIRIYNYVRLVRDVG